jgi:hypothetical protein
MANTSNSILALIGAIFTVLFAILIWPDILFKITSNAENKQLAQIFINSVLVVFLIVLIASFAKISEKGM